MRIIGGKYKSRRITPPSKLPVRPTTDIAREGLFNLLRTRVDLSTSRVIDLFSGTGFISYEFISQGATSVIAVEKHYACTAFIKQSAALLKTDNIHVIRADVFQFLRTNNSSSDLIFADPPYQLESLHELPDRIIDSNALKSGGILILEHGPDHSFQDHPAFSEERHYGKVHFSFFRKPDHSAKEEET